MDFDRNELVFLRTLTNLRWLAIFGQTIAVLIGTNIIGLELSIGYCFLLILISFFVNIFSTFFFSNTKRLSEKSTLIVLMFDLFQLSSLLYLCGGLTNPFAVLILAPVVISATLLPLMPTIFLCLTAITLVSYLSYIYIPLELEDGTSLLLPNTLMFGMWSALIITIVFISAYAWRVKKDVTRINQLLVATKLALEREQKLTALGGVVAAAAHELGSPLTTIKLVSSELLEELSNKSNKDATVEDLELIKSQAERCKEILKNMETDVVDDNQIQAVPIIALVKEACLPFQNRGKDIIFSLKNLENTDEQDNEDQIVIRRTSEIIHGLRNIIQNATDFSKRNVFINISWSPSDVKISIRDDGPGFPESLLSKIGEPFINKRKNILSDADRPEYESMGLGLFIAKTLLERSGAELTFKNYSLTKEGEDGFSGAEASAIWNRKIFEETWSKQKSIA